jgi:glycerol-3-phosphate cytidylyltransferase-like family protein
VDQVLQAHHLDLQVQMVYQVKVDLVLHQEAQVHQEFQEHLLLLVPQVQQV